MSRAVLGAFILGIALASGVAYLMTRHSQPGAPAAETATPLQPQAAPAPQPAEVAPAPAAQPAAAEMAARPKPSPTRRARPLRPAAEPVETARIQPPVPEPAPAPAPAAQPSIAPPPVENVQPAPPPPPPPPVPRTVTIPAGTVLTVRLNQGLDSDKNQPGDSFAATLDQPLVIDGMVIAERGARVQGRVLDSQRAGRVKGLSHLSLQLVQLQTSDGQRVSILTQPWEKEGQSSTKNDVVKTGAAAAIGAAIGALAGGGRGAAIGAGVGGAAGAGGVMVTRGKAVHIPVETRIPFRLAEPVALTERLN